MPHALRCFSAFMLLFHLSTPTAALAATDPPASPTTPTATEMQFKGKLLTRSDGKAKGMITLNSRAVGIEHKSLFSSRSWDFRFTDMTSVKVKKNLLHTEIIMTPADGSGDVIIQTRPWFYDEARGLLRSRL